jgi:hypothetical protein
MYVYGGRGGVAGCVVTEGTNPGLNPTPFARGATCYLRDIHEWASKDYPQIVDRHNEIGPDLVQPNQKSLKVICLKAARNYPASS